MRRSFLFLVVGMLLGAGILGYGYFSYQNLQNQKYISTTQSTIVTQLQGLSRLVSAEMTISKIIESKKEFSDFLPSISWDNTLNSLLFDDRLLMTIEAKINAGVDLSKIGSGNIQIEKNEQNIYAVDLVLPQAEIFDVYLTEKTKPFERKIGLLSKGNQELETTIRNDTISIVRKEALEEGILTSAEENAIKTVRELLIKLGLQVSSVKFE